MIALTRNVTSSVMLKPIMYVKPTAQSFVSVSRRPIKVAPQLPHCMWTVTVSAFLSKHGHHLTGDRSGPAARIDK